MSQGPARQRCCPFSPACIRRPLARCASSALTSPKTSTRYAPTWVRGRASLAGTAPARPDGRSNPPARRPPHGPRPPASAPRGLPPAKHPFGPAVGARAFGPVCAAERSVARCAPPSRSSSLPDLHLPLFVCATLARAHPCLPSGIPEEAVDAAVDAMIAQSDLSDQAAKLAKRLSGGQKRKLSVGIALIGDPKILFLECARRHAGGAAGRAL